MVTCHINCLKNQKIYYICYMYFTFLNCVNVANVVGVFCGMYPTLLIHGLEVFLFIGTSDIIRLTSSTSFNHRSRPSNDHLLVMSYTSRTPCAPREYDLIIVQNLPCPEVSHSCSLTRFPSSKIVVVLYAEAITLK